MRLTRLIFIFTFFLNSAFAEVDCGPKFYSKEKYEELLKFEKDLRCSQFFDEFKPEFKKQYGVLELGNPSNNFAPASFTCSGVTLAGVVAAKELLSQGTREQIVKKLPAFMSRLGVAAFPFMIFFSHAFTIYAITDLTIEGLEADEKCFNDIEKKSAMIDLLSLTSQSLLSELSDKLTPFEKTQLTFSPNFLGPAYKKNVTCQQIKEVTLIQKRKQDEIIGKLIASKKIDGDPRKMLKLTNEEMSLYDNLFDNLDCISPAKKLEMTCALANVALGTLQLKAFLGAIQKFRLPPNPNKEILYSVKPIQIPPLETPIIKPPNLEISPRIPLNKFFHDSRYYHTTYIVEDLGKGSRFEVGEIKFIDPKGMSPFVAGAHVNYPKFQAKIGVKISENGKKVIRPSDSETHNKLIGLYNANLPVAKKIPVHFVDDYTPKGISAENLVRGWGRNAEVPINQVNQKLHIHDNEFHAEAYQLLPMEVVERSKANYSLMLKLIDHPSFKHSYRLKDSAYKMLGDVLDASPIGLTNGLSKVENTTYTLNNLILKKEAIKDFFSRFTLTRAQQKELDKTLSELKPALTPEEAEGIHKIIRERAELD